jgi:hypothetical protein
MTKPLLYLHIGMGKTGTTSIQGFCWANRERLAEEGRWYPDLGVEAGAHHRLSPYVPPFLAKTWTFLAADDWAPKLAAEARMPVVLSSELMSNATPAMIRQFAAVVLQHFEVRVLVYIRRIDDHVMAAYNQQVKVGMQLYPIEEVVGALFSQLRPDRVLKPWRDAFGVAQVQVRPYEGLQFPEGDIQRDFCAAIGVRWRDDFQRDSDNPNARLGRKALEYKRNLNNLILDGTLGQAFIQPLQDYSAAHEEASTQMFRPPDLLPASVRLAMMDRLAAFYRRLAREGLGRGDGVLFLAERPAEDQPWSPLTLTTDDIRGITETIATDRLREILAAQVAEARAGSDLSRLLFAGRFAL